MIDTVVDGVTGVHVAAARPGRALAAALRGAARRPRRRAAARRARACAARAPALRLGPQSPRATRDVYATAHGADAAPRGAAERALRGRADRGASHLAALRAALAALEAEVERLERWGAALADAPARRRPAARRGQRRQRRRRRST